MISLEFATSTLCLRWERDGSKSKGKRKLGRKVVDFCSFRFHLFLCVGVPRLESPVSCLACRRDALRSWENLREVGYGNINRTYVAGRSQTLEKVAKFIWSCRLLGAELPRKWKCLCISTNLQTSSVCQRRLYANL